MIIRTHFSKFVYFKKSSNVRPLEIQVVHTVDFYFINYLSFMKFLSKIVLITLFIKQMPTI